MVHDAAFDESAHDASAFDSEVFEGGDAALAEPPADLDLTADLMPAHEDSAREDDEALEQETVEQETAEQESGEQEAASEEAAATEASLAEEPEEEDEGPAAELDEEQLDALTQSLGVLLFASPEPLNLGRLKELSEAPDKAAVRQGLGELEERFERAALPLVVRKLAGGYRVMTDPRLAEVVQRLDKSRKTERISQAALETLSIIAYRQPVTKAEIEAIRGVQAGPMLRTLVDRGLVKIAGRAEQPGQPLLYGTTKEFLDRFGLGALNELPRDAELAGE
ncbi:MAG: SMC-Scp complex subunit ScpB [Planctomycetota bacterium]|jgi:segregation and condensation protein B